MGIGGMCGFPVGQGHGHDTRSLSELACVRQWNEIQDEIRRVEMEKSRYGPFFVEIDERVPVMRISVSHPHNDVTLKSDNHEFLTDTGPLVDACGLVGASALARRRDTGGLEVILGIPSWALGINAYELAAIRPIPGVIQCHVANIPRTRDVAHFAFVYAQNETFFRRPATLSDAQVRTYAATLVSAVANLHAEGINLFGLIAPQVILMDSNELRLLPLGALITFRALQTTCALDPSLPQYLAPEMRRWLSRGNTVEPAPLAFEQLRMADVFAVGNFICLLALGCTASDVDDVVDAALRSFLVALCAADVGARWSCEEALQHPWLNVRSDVPAPNPVAPTLRT